MLNIFSPIYTSDELSMSVYLICLVASLVLGGIIAVASAVKSRASKSFLLALVLLPAIVQTLIMLVNDSVGAGVAVMGAFSLVRFRSAPGSAKEIVGIFLSMAAGLATAKGYIALAVVFVVIISAFIVLSNFIHLKGHDDLQRELRITVPEDLNYSHEFDDLFGQYTKSFRLMSVKTSNMGSLYKLLYRVELKSEDQAQAFIDELRCRNGNLEIALMIPAVEGNTL